MDLGKAQKNFFHVLKLLLKQVSICFSKGDFVRLTILVSFCCIRNTSKTCSLNQPLCNKLMVLQGCSFGWDQMIGSSELDWG